MRVETERVKLLGIVLNGALYAMRTGSYYTFRDQYFTL